MTTKELFTFDKAMPEEEFYLLGYFRWQDLQPRAALAKDSSGTLVVLHDEEQARNYGKAFAAKFCKEGVDDGTVYCSVIVHVTRGGGKEIKDTVITCFSNNQEMTYQETIRNLETLFIERGIYEV